MATTRMVDSMSQSPFLAMFSLPDNFFQEDIIAVNREGCCLNCWCYHPPQSSWPIATSYRKDIIVQIKMFLSIVSRKTMLGFKKQLNSLEKEAKKHADHAI
jgi:hypothetical protein